MSELKYSLRRSFNSHILLMHYQRTDPWVDSDQWVISQELHKANLVHDSRWENFISCCSYYQGEKKWGRYRNSAIEGWEIEKLSLIKHQVYSELATGWETLWRKRMEESRSLDMDLSGLKGMTDLGLHHKPVAQAGYSLVPYLAQR